MAGVALDATTVGGSVAVEIAVLTNAVDAACVVLVPEAAVGTNGVPVNVGEARLALSASPAVREVASAVTAVVTKAVVAIEVSLSPVVGVGAVGLPVSTGDANGAFEASAAVARVVSVATAVEAAPARSYVPAVTLTVGLDPVPPMVIVASAAVMPATEVDPPTTFDQVPGVPPDLQIQIPPV
jgi:hypothetical protein